MNINLNVTGNKWLNSQIDSRIAIIIVVFGFITVLFITNISILIYVLILNFLLFFLLPNSSIKKLLIILIFLTLFVSFFTFINILSFTEGTISLIKLININLLLSWFYLGVPPHELARALIWFRIPYTWAWTLSSSFRFIDLFIRETKDIYIAQLLRQIPLDGNVINRLKYIPSVIIPLIVRTQIRANQLAEALYIRGWNPNKKLGIYSAHDFNILKNLFWFICYIGLIIFLSFSLV